MRFSAFLGISVPTITAYIIKISAEGTLTGALWVISLLGASLWAAKWQPPFKLKYTIYGGGGNPYLVYFATIY